MLKTPPEDMSGESSSPAGNHFFTVNPHEAKSWVDASFSTHCDMMSHTGGVMSLGKGVICASSKRQRINTKSSTEAEIVGINHVLPQILWTCYFLEAQGYPVLKPTNIYQDNMRTILLGKNGKASNGQRTHHINI